MLIVDAAPYMYPSHLHMCFSPRNTSIAASCAQLVDFSKLAAFHSCIHSFIQPINHAFMHSCVHNNCCCDECKKAKLHAKLGNHDQGVTYNRGKCSTHNPYLRAPERNEACSVCSIPRHPHICAVIPMDHSGSRPNNAGGVFVHLACGHNGSPHLAQHRRAGATVA